MTAAAPELTPFVYPASGLSEVDQALRAGRITASLAPMILAESAFGDALLAYRSILGIGQPRSSYTMQIGIIDEPKIGALHMLRHPSVRLYRAPTVVHPKLDWLAASVDFIGESPEGQRYILEAKSTDETNRSYWGAPGTAEVPAGYRIQVAVQLACWGLDKALFGLLVGRDDYREYRVVRDPAFESNIIGLLDEWRVRHLVARVPPVSRDVRLYASTVYPEPTEDIRPADEEIETVACMEELRAAAAAKRRAERAFEGAAAAVCLCIGEAEGVSVGRATIRWKKRTNSRERVLTIPPKWYRTDEEYEATEEENEQ